MSDPNQDPCGYRSLFCVYLAETELGNPGLFERVVASNANLGVQVEVRLFGPGTCKLPRRRAIAAEINRVITSPRL